MDLPIHLATGALVGSVVLYVDQTMPHNSNSPRQLVKVGVACFLLGVLSHLLLDAMPHYDWLFYITIFKPLPFWWHIPQVIAAIPVVAFTWYMLHDHSVIAMISLLGGIYPDLEKLAYFDFHLPRELVIFEQHSCYLSQWRSWELAHKTFLIVFETLLLLTLLMLAYWISVQRNKRALSTAYFEVTYENILASKTDADCA
ncbi:hypothetical protein U27_02066 [Candidatus Vecturithrix granuli]|uniref:Uncharacterized protein n=1 Tax=Vecturithrix granuli TaxID=1499967 RepID=A0A0S6W9T5_VECG1|nr:hypothetical protein U27_02066 [Candidatus Vecturithrix granuli]